MTRRPYQTFLLVLTIALVWMLFACTPPCYQTGIHHVAVALPPIPRVIAVEDSRYCPQRLFYSQDGGDTWPGEMELSTGEVDLVAVISQAQDCAAGCQFTDLNNPDIQYRLQPGRLERSLDGGQTWREELSLPDWAGFERVYLQEKFAQRSNIDFGLRGPFHAVTDPGTGRLIVAMGYEGVLLRDEGEDWKWVQIRNYQPVQISRMAMLTYIPPADWFRGILVGLFFALLGIRRLGYRGNTGPYWFGQMVSVIILLLPFILLVYAGAPYENGFLRNAVEFANMLFSLGLIAALAVLAGGVMVSVLIAGLGVLKQHKVQRVSAVLGIMAVGALSYWVGPLLWSQGVLLDKGNAFLIGLFGAGLIGCGMVLRLPEGTLVEAVESPVAELPQE